MSKRKVDIRVNAQRHTDERTIWRDPDQDCWIVVRHRGMTDAGTYQNTWSLMEAIDPDEVDKTWQLVARTEYREVIDTHLLTEYGAALINPKALPDSYPSPEPVIAPSRDTAEIHDYHSFGADHLVPPPEGK